MRNFQRIASGVDVMPLLHALQRNEDLWNANKFRTTFKNTPHGDVDDIWLRYSEPEAVLNPDDIRPIIAGHEVTWYEAAHDLPFKPIVCDLMRRVEAYSLERLLITRLKPGGRILPHADNAGEYVHQGDIGRYHVVLQGLPGSLMRCGDERVNMQTGEVWWFNAHIEHEVANNSTDDRIHMLVDVRTMPA